MPITLSFLKPGQEAVADYLISKGIDSKRLTSKGFGEAKPIADNSTEEGEVFKQAHGVYCYRFVNYVSRFVDFTSLFLVKTGANHFGTIFASDN